MEGKNYYYVILRNYKHDITRILHIVIYFFTTFYRQYDVILRNYIV